MNRPGPIFDRKTHYRIEVHGRVDVEWLQSFDGLADIHVDETEQKEALAVLDVYTDQAGFIGLMRRLHGLGMAILQFQTMPGGGNASDIEEQR